MNALSFGERLNEAMLVPKTFFIYHKHQLYCRTTVQFFYRGNIALSQDRLQTCQILQSLPLKVMVGFEEMQNG